MSSDARARSLAELLTPGLTWPGYKNEEKNRVAIVYGYSMEKNMMNIPLSRIGSGVLWK